MNSLGGSAARASDSGSMPSAVLYVPAEEPEYILMLREGINRTPLPDSVLRIVSEYAEYQIVGDMNALSIEAAKPPPDGLRRYLSDQWRDSMQRLQHSAARGADPSLCGDLTQLTDCATETWLRSAWQRDNYGVGRPRSFAATITGFRLGEWWRWNCEIRALGLRFPPDVQADVNAAQDAASGMCRLAVYDLTCQGLDGEPLWTKLRALLRNADRVIDELAAEFAATLLSTESATRFELNASHPAERFDRRPLINDAVRAMRANCMTLAGLMEVEVNPDIDYMALLAEPRALYHLEKLIDEFKGPGRSQFHGRLVSAMGRTLSAMGSLLAAPVFIVDTLNPPASCDASAVERAAKGGLTEQELQVVRQAMQVHHREVARGDFDGLLNAVRGELQPGSLDMLSTLLRRPAFQASVAREFE